MASRGINKVILVGRLGKDPETRYMPSGGAVTNITMATSETWRDKQSGQNQERTEWHRVVFFNRLAEIAGEYLKKGSLIYIEGSIRTRKWQDQQGNDRYTTEIVANEMQMLDSRAGSGTGVDGDSSYDASYQQIAPPDGAAAAGAGAAAAQQPQAAGQPQSGAASPGKQPAAAATAPAGFESFDDDIPF